MSAYARSALIFTSKSSASSRGRDGSASSGVGNKQRGSSQTRNAPLNNGAQAHPGGSGQSNNSRMACGPAEVSSQLLSQGRRVASISQNVRAKQASTLGVSLPISTRGAVVDGSQTQLNFPEGDSMPAPFLPHQMQPSARNHSMQQHQFSIPSVGQQHLQRQIQPGVMSSTNEFNGSGHRFQQDSQYAMSQDNYGNLRHFNGRISTNQLSTGNNGMQQNQLCSQGANSRALSRMAGGYHPHSRHMSQPLLGDDSAGNTSQGFSMGFSKQPEHHDSEVLLPPPRERRAVNGSYCLSQPDLRDIASMGVTADERLMRATVLSQSDRRDLSSSHYGLNDSFSYGGTTKQATQAATTRRTTTAPKQQQTSNKKKSLLSQSMWMNTCMDAVTRPVRSAVKSALHPWMNSCMNAVLHPYSAVSASNNTQSRRKTILDKVSKEARSVTNKSCESSKSRKDSRGRRSKKDTERIVLSQRPNGKRMKRTTSDEELQGNKSGQIDTSLILGKVVDNDDDHSMSSAEVPLRHKRREKRGRVPPTGKHKEEDVQNMPPDKISQRQRSKSAVQGHMCETEAKERDKGDDLFTSSDESASDRQMEDDSVYDFDWKKTCKLDTKTRKEKKCRPMEEHHEGPRCSAERRSEDRAGDNKQPNKCFSKRDEMKAADDEREAKKGKRRGKHDKVDNNRGRHDRDSRCDKLISDGKKDAATLRQARISVHEGMQLHQKYSHKDDQRPCSKRDVASARAPVSNTQNGDIENTSDEDSGECKPRGRTKRNSAASGCESSAGKRSGNMKHVEEFLQHECTMENSDSNINLVDRFEKRKSQALDSNDKGSTKETTVNESRYRLKEIEGNAQRGCEMDTFGDKQEGKDGIHIPTLVNAENEHPNPYSKPIYMPISEGRDGLSTADIIRPMVKDTVKVLVHDAVQDAKRDILEFMNTKLAAMLHASAANCSQCVSKDGKEVKAALVKSVVSVSGVHVEANDRVLLNNTSVGCGAKDVDEVEEEDGNDVILHSTEVSSLTDCFLASQSVSHATKRGLSKVVVPKADMRPHSDQQPHAQERRRVTNNVNCSGAKRNVPLGGKYGAAIESKSTPECYDEKRVDGPLTEVPSTYGSRTPIVANTNGREACLEGLKEALHDGDLADEFIGNSNEGGATTSKNSPYQRPKRRVMKVQRYGDWSRSSNHGKDGKDGEGVDYTSCNCRKSCIGSKGADCWKGQCDTGSIVETSDGETRDLARLEAAPSRNIRLSECGELCAVIGKNQVKVTAQSTPSGTENNRKHLSIVSSPSVVASSIQQSCVESWMSKKDIENELVIPETATNCLPHDDDKENIDMNAAKLSVNHGSACRKTKRRSRVLKRCAERSLSSSKEDSTRSRLCPLSAYRTPLTSQITPPNRRMSRSGKKRINVDTAASGTSVPRSAATRKGICTPNFGAFELDDEFHFSEASKRPTTLDTLKKDNVVSPVHERFKVGLGSQRKTKLFASLNVEGRRQYKRKRNADVFSSIT